MTAIPTPTNDALWAWLMYDHDAYRAEQANWPDPLLDELAASEQVAAVKERRTLKAAWRKGAR